jgi:hypothetical protein
VSPRDGTKEHPPRTTKSFAKNKIGKEMKIPALTDLAKDVTRIADALEALAKHADRLVNLQGPGDTDNARYIAGTKRIDND